MQRILATLAVVAALTACDARSPDSAAPVAPDASHVSDNAAPQVIASGLWFPRGFAFGRDGAIYVAEAGVPEGNEMSTIGQCAQVPGAPGDGPGPWTGGFTGRISRVTMHGERTTVASALPSGRDQFGDVEGPADIAFHEHQMFLMISAGCAHGHLNEPSSLNRVEKNGKLHMTADLSRWLHANPTAHPEPDDFEPDGSWYSMVAADERFFLVEANQGNLVSVRPNDGHIRRVADVSATENGHVVPTAVSLVRGRDDVLVGELRPFPSVPGSADVIRYDRDGSVDSRLHGFTAILGTASDWRGNTYVLESFTCPTADPCFPSPGSGQVIRVARDGTRSVVATGLSFAGALRMGPDGALYVSNFSYGPPRMGQILRIPI
ncbi:MAG: ScyD/ScyE family protein [Gemmatimonadaceae bacterium]